MIRVLEEVLPVLQNAAAYDGSVYRVTLAGDSTETKPTRGIMTGSKFVETDTGETLYFDESTQTWN